MRLSVQRMLSWNWKSVFLGTVMTVATAAFIFTGFGKISFSAIQNKGTDDPYTAAVVGNSSVSMQQLHEALEKAPHASDKPLTLASPESWRILQQLSLSLLKAQEAERIGVPATDGAVAAMIRTVPEFQDSKTHQFSYILFKLYTMQIGDADTQALYMRLRRAISVENLESLTQFSLALASDATQLFEQPLAEENAQWLWENAYKHHDIRVNTSLGKKI